MNKDRTFICETISNMLDNPNQYGIYPTTECYDKLEQYIEQIRCSSHWISVEDVLPKEDSVVFIFCQCIAYAAKEENSLYDMQIVGTYRSGNNKFTACVDSTLDGYKITHWRPQFAAPEDR